ncbi:MAG TPA: hypothetical protein VH701_11575 [Vicinamibacterales bacterium]|jgi:hypothetical protein
MGHGVIVISHEEMLRRICGEYLEMPGLRLQSAQAQRLWGLDAGTCAELLDFLVEQRFLQRTESGSYMRLSDGMVPVSPIGTKMRFDSNPPHARSGRKPSAA